MNTQIRNMWTVQFKNQIKARMNPIDTTAIQYNSLVSFMKELGYEPVRMYSGFRKFDKSKTLYAPNFLSFKHAQYLHNGAMFRVCGSLFDSMGLPYTFQVDTEVWEKAKKAKYCKETYLIKLKKYPFIKANKHWISLQNDSEWDSMFNDPLDPLAGY